MDLKFTFNKEAGQITVDEEEGTVSVTFTPAYYTSSGKYIPTANVTRVARSGPVIGKTAVEVHKDTGEIRVIDLIEEEELPVDRKFKEKQSDDSADRAEQGREV